MSKKIIQTNNAPAPIGPYNQAVMAGDYLYVSGQVPIDPQNNEVLRGSIKEQTHLVMKNLKAILDEAGLGMAHIVKSSIFIKDMGQFAEINEVYGSYFTSDYPARETVEVAGLPKGVDVEISVIAYKN